MMTRRRFIKCVIVFSNSLMIPMNSMAGAEKATGKIDISKFDISVPLWLLDKNSNQKDRAKALGIQINQTTDKVVFIFSRNQKLSLNPSTSVDSLIKNNKNKATRTSMLLKRTISYALDAIYKQNRIKSKFPLKKYFENFLTEEIIIFITAGSLYKLIVDLDSHKTVSVVKWEYKSRKFKVK